MKIAHYTLCSILKTFCLVLVTWYEIFVSSLFLQFCLSTDGCLFQLLTGIMAWRLAKYPTAMEVEAELDKIRGGANAAISSSNTNISPRQQGGPGLFSRTPSYTYTPSILLYQQDSSPDNRASFVTAPPQVTGPYPQDLYRNSTTTIPKRRSPRRRRASK